METQCHIKVNGTMTNESETYRHPFRALLTGYGFFGGWDYAHFPASGVPELSLRGDKPFTLFVTLCFKNIQGGTILEQKDMFQLGIMDGLIYVIGPDWCGIKFPESTLGRFTPQCWYRLGLVYDGNLLTVYLDGVKKDTFRCKPASKRTAKAELVIGEKLDAYFKDFRIFDRALPDEQMQQLASDGEIRPENSIAWFDFDRTGRKDQSPNRVKLTTKAFCRIVIVKPVRQFRFNINRKYDNVEEMICEQFNTPKPISFTGCIGSKPDDDTHTQLTGIVSLGTPNPVVCGLEGEIVTVWESIDIAQNDDM